MPGHDAASVSLPRLPDDAVAPPLPDEHVAPLRNRRPLVPRRRTGFVAAVVAGTLVATLTGGTLVVSQRNRTTVVTATTAVERFRSGDAGTDTSLLARPAADPIPDTRANLAAATAGAGAPDQTAPEARDAGPYARPDAGVYPYRSAGGERISVLGAQHDYPERVYMTVRHLGDCSWELRNDVVEEHVDVLRLCSQPGAFLQHEQSRTVTFFGQQEGSTFRCEPPTQLHATGDQPGARSTNVCTNDDGDEARIERTFLGTDAVMVGDQSLEAVHVRLDSTLSGTAEGTARDELWLAPDTGLPYRWIRTVDTVASTSFGARVRYQEEAEFTLETLEPAT